MAIKCWHDLRHDDPSCIPLAEELQLLGQRGAAHKDTLVSIMSG